MDSTKIPWKGFKNSQGNFRQEGRTNLLSVKIKILCNCSNKSNTVMI